MLTQNALRLCSSALSALHGRSPRIYRNALRLAGDHSPDGIASYVLHSLRDAAPDKENPLQFMTFALRHLSLAKGQNFQDLWALWESGEKRGGYFVEFGAGDGVHLSNTYFLEKHMGWSGVLAEPNPSFSASIRQHRSCAIIEKCVYATPGEVEFLATSHRELSRIASINPRDRHESRRTGSIIRVPTVTLDALLDEAEAPDEIDYMSIDTEGSELAILENFDFSRRRIHALSIEHNDRAAAQIDALLGRVGYRRKWPDLSLFDGWYVSVR